MSKGNRGGRWKGKNTHSVTSSVLPRAASDISQFIKIIFQRQILREREGEGGRTLTRHFALVISASSGVCCVLDPQKDSGNGHGGVPGC